MSTLPEDVVVDILSRLPVKSLMRFRSVCKSWCNLLQHEDFIVKHHKHQIASSKVNVLVKHGCEEEQYLSVLSSTGRDGGGETLSVVERISGLSITPNRVNFQSTGPVSDEMLCVAARVYELSLLGVNLQILGPVNGLLCVYHDRNSGKIALWNPATREFKTLPCSTIPDVTYHTVGFGFDTRTNDYKILRFVRNHDDTLNRVELYSLNYDTWREIAPPSFDAHEILPCCEASNNGVFYCCPVSEGGYSRRLHCPVLLIFDFGDEVFKELPLRGLEGYWNSYPFRLIVFNKQLSVMILRTSCGNTSIDMWLMTGNEDEVSWKLHATIGPLRGWVYPLGFRKNSLFLENRGSVMLYDLKTQELEDLQIHGVGRDIRVAHYVESLVRINNRHSIEHEPFTRGNLPVWQTMMTDLLRSSGNQWRNEEA